MSHVLIVEDDADAARMMSTLVSSLNHSVVTAASLHDARRRLAMQHPDVVLLDLQLPDGSGMELFEPPDLMASSEVILITGHASLETSVQALRYGAADYLIKPVGPRQLQGILARCMRPQQLQAEMGKVSEEWQRTGHFGGLWGRSEVMQTVYQQIIRVAQTSISVFVTGESGTGKEVVARTVHDLSRRRANPFLAVNCGAISRHLIESELFGHEKGSFTGADVQHQGYFERAHGGTLFLDEVTEMPLELQVKLLRVLETGTFMRVGSTQLRETDVRIVAATNRPAEQAVQEQRLREDLLYRLNVFPIAMPRLEERPDDVPLLANRFLDEICAREGRVKRFTPAALEVLSAYRWPGNVRELRNVVQRAYVMAEGDRITDEWLPRTSGIPAPVATRAPDPASAAATMTMPLGGSLADAERRFILASYQHFQHHRERTAAALGISIKTLYNRLKYYLNEEDGGSG